MDNEELAARYDLVEKLIKLFKFERFVHLAITVLSLVMLFVAIGLMISKGVDTAALSLMFGSSGLITYTAGRLLKMWDQALKIIITGKL